MKLFIHMFLGFIAFGLIGDTFASGYPQPLTTYDIWCPPQEDTCIYTTLNEKSQRIYREDLPYVFPTIHGGTNCFREFCFDSQENVIGLNPDYSF